jgi:hypothetical protein
MKTTTIKIYSEDLRWWKVCCESKRKNSQETFSEFRQSVRLQKNREYYLSLPMPSDYKRKLEGKRIDKSKVATKIYG